MTLSVVWSDEATADLLEILDYIAQRNPDAADRIDALAQQSIERLPDHPYMHRLGRRPRHAQSGRPQSASERLMDESVGESTFALQDGLTHDGND